MLATHSLADGSTLLMIAALIGTLLLGTVEPAAAAHAGGHQSQLLGDVSENADFWGNVLRYVSYFFSVLLGTAYIAVRPILELMKKPTTAVLVLGGLAGLVYFVSFTVQARRGSGRATLACLLRSAGSYEAGVEHKLPNAML
jgi:cytosine/uracil/thiamine/allantoin permease